MHVQNGFDSFWSLLCCEQKGVVSCFALISPSQEITVSHAFSERGTGKCPQSAQTIQQRLLLLHVWTVLQGDFVCNVVSFFVMPGHKMHMLHHPTELAMVEHVMLEVWTTFVAKK